MGAKIFISWMPGSPEACSLCSHLRDSCLLVWCCVERLQKVKTKLSKEHLSRTQGRVLGVWILHPTPQMWPPVPTMTGRLASSHSFRDITIWQLSSVSPGGNRAMFRSFSLNWLWTSPWQQYTTAGRDLQESFEDIRGRWLISEGQAFTSQRWKLLVFLQCKESENSRRFYLHALWHLKSAYWDLVSKQPARSGLANLMRMNLSGWMILHHGACPVHYRMLNSIFLWQMSPHSYVFPWGAKYLLVESQWSRSLKEHGRLSYPSSTGTS